MRRRRLKSISVPIALGAITVPLSAALLVGWSILLGQKIARSEEIAGDVWLLVLGAISFVVIMGVLILFSISLARGIIEVRKQDSFIDSVTHELKSPLASIQLCLETLIREGVKEAQREELRQMMLEDVERLRSFIDDVLISNRLLHTKGGLINLSDVNLYEMLESCVEVLTGRYKLPADSVTLHLDPELCLTTDRAALELIVKNLIDNAIKYSEAEARIEVHAHGDSKGRVEVRVSDQGIGIPKHDLKRVFNRFFRGENDAVRRRRGTGLGLFVVSALVRELDGRIEVSSEGLGKGTTLRLLLPGITQQVTS